MVGEDVAIFGDEETSAGATLGALLLAAAQAWGQLAAKETTQHVFLPGAGLGVSTNLGPLHFGFDKYHAWFGFSRDIAEYGGKAAQFCFGCGDMGGFGIGPGQGGAGAERDNRSDDESGAQGGSHECGHDCCSPRVGHWSRRQHRRHTYRCSVWAIEMV
jgi:hypothetical protein